MKYDKKETIKKLKKLTSFSSEFLKIIVSPAPNQLNEELNKRGFINLK